MRYFIRIEQQDGRYAGLRHEGNPAFGQRLADLKLGPDDEVGVKGQSYSLATLVETLIDHKRAELDTAFDERGQLELGQHLYAQVFGDMEPAAMRAREDEQVDLRIVTEDEHLARLPWVLLAHKGLFLSMTGFSVSLARASQVDDCELPPAPRLLVVAPEPAGVSATRAEAHLEMLENRHLAPFDPRLSRGDHLRVVHTWERFVEMLPQFEPHVIYYYGHGVGSLDRSRLVFAAGDARKRDDRPIGDFAQALRALKEAPRLVYVNCCSGDAGGFLGAGRQLGEFVPAVITNRTLAYVEAAQAQALALLPSILVDAVPPHRAMAEMLPRLADMNLSLRDARWMTPVLHCNYGRWTATLPRRVDPLEHDPHWHLKLDRIRQYGTVSLQTRTMLRERRPRSLAYLWYGREGQGVERFHRRLNVELSQELPTNAHFLEVQPEWPMELQDPDRSFADMLCEAFDVLELADIPKSVRARTRGATSRQTLIYVRHQPVTSAKLINPATLKLYLKWWDQSFVPLLQRRHYALLGVSFIVRRPARFYAFVRDRERLDDLDLSLTVFRTLDELERVGRRDLLDFLKTHNIRLPPQRRDRMLQEILDRTKGHYDITVSALRKLVSRQWDRADGTGVAEATEEEYDY